jgi:L-rhamnose mutarotase
MEMHMYGYQKTHTRIFITALFVKITVGNYSVVLHRERSNISIISEVEPRAHEFKVKHGGVC